MFKIYREMKAAGLTKTEMVLEVLGALLVFSPVLLLWVPSLLK